MFSYYDFIKSNEKLSELPFMVVLRTLQILDDLKVLYIPEDNQNVG